MTTLQYMCYLGWMKVAASLMNPYGDDEDDFECNFLIDKNIAVRAIQHQVMIVIFKQLSKQHCTVL